MKLLIAEDDPRLLKTLIHIFQTNKYIADGVSNGNDALEYALTGEYDGLVLDIPMEDYVPHEHSFTETIDFASCTEEGRSYLSCPCGLIYKDKTIDKTSHLILTEVVTPATQEAAGMARHYCANCDYEEQEVLEKLPMAAEEPEEEPSFWESLFGWLWA